MRNLVAVGGSLRPPLERLARSAKRKLSAHFRHRVASTGACKVRYGKSLRGATRAREPTGQIARIPTTSELLLRGLTDDKIPLLDLR